MPREEALRIAPSLLSKSFARLGDEVSAGDRGGADLLHFDVLDNHYLPTLTVGPLVCKAIRASATVPIDLRYWRAASPRREVRSWQCRCQRVSERRPF